MKALKGEDCPTSKLTEEKVKAIRASSLPYRELKEKYNISMAQISRIKNNKQWINESAKETGRPEKNILDKFWSRVKKMPSGCWHWTGIQHRNKTTHDLEYGILQVGPRNNRKNIRANRLSWELHYGPIPEGMMVLHKCDNKLCVNPEHLELGDNSKNIQDAWDRGLMRKRIKEDC